MPGRIAEHELAAHFDATDIFCLPSDSKAEAFGVVLLEGMRAGKPIVASDIEGSGVGWVNEHGKTGLNVPPAEVTQLVAAIKSLLEDPLRAAEYGTAARLRYLEHFTAQRMVQRCMELYAELGLQLEVEPASITDAAMSGQSSAQRERLDGSHSRAAEADASRAGLVSVCVATFNGEHLSSPSSCARSSHPGASTRSSSPTTARPTAPWTSCVPSMIRASRSLPDPASD